MTITVTTEIRQKNDDYNSILIATHQDGDTIRLTYYQNAKNLDITDFRINLTHEFIRRIYQVFVAPCS